MIIRLNIAHLHHIINCSIETFRPHCTYHQQLNKVVNQGFVKFCRATKNLCSIYFNAIFNAIMCKASAASNLIS